MKHIVRDNRDNKPQGVHMPGATESQTKPQPAVETGPTTRKKPRTCPTISVVKAHSITFRAEHLNIKLCAGVTQGPGLENLHPMICTQDLRQYRAWNTRPMLISGKRTPSGLASAGNPNQTSIFMMPHDLSY